VNAGARENEGGDLMTRTRRMLALQTPALVPSEIKFSAARANQVLDDIAESIGNVNEECQRICLLIKEALDNKYWKIRFANVKEWGQSLFGTYHAFRNLRELAITFMDQPDLLSELGRGRCRALVPLVNQEGEVSQEWIDKAKKMTCRELNIKVRRSIPLTISGKHEKAILLTRIRHWEKRLAWCQIQIVKLPIRIQKARSRIGVIEEQKLENMVQVAAKI
jgi:hypothetical protein